MATRNMFFDAVSGDRSYDATSLAALLRSLVQRDGVVYNYGSALAVSATDPVSMNVSVALGAAFVQGRFFEVHTAAELKAIGAADPTNPRIDRVVVKLDNSAGVRSVTLAVKAGTPAASPAPPALQRDGTVWELSLAQVYVAAGATSISAANITDERSDATLCGNAFGFLSSTTGHKHTGAAGDGPKLTHDAINTAAISAFRAYQSAAQSIAATTYTQVAFQTEVFDHLGEYDPATYRFTAQKAGIYVFHTSVEIVTLADGSRVTVYLYQNGALQLGIFSFANGAAKTARAAGSAMLKLNAGDYVAAYVYIDTAHNTAALSHATWFEGYRIA